MREDRVTIYKGASMGRTEVAGFQLVAGAIYTVCLEQRGGVWGANVTGNVPPSKMTRRGRRRARGRARVVLVRLPALVHQL